MSKNYRSKAASHQDHVLAKTFKKLLLKTNPTMVSTQGFIPIWVKKSHKSVIGEYEPTQENCFVLPLAGPASFRSILNSIRREKPVDIFEVKSAEGVIVSKPISNLTEADLARSLKNLSLIIFSEPDEKKWFHFDGNGCQSALKIDPPSASKIDPPQRLVFV